MNISASTLDENLNKVRALRTDHTDISRIAVQLAATITHLLNTAQDGILRINSTATEVTTGLAKERTTVRRPRSRLDQIRRCYVYSVMLMHNSLV